MLPEGTPKRKMAVLDQILDGVRANLPERRTQRAELEKAVASLPAPPCFASALQRTTVALIAEVKRRSPSAGAINPGLDPVELATRYAGGGAAAISVLTEGPHFGGSLDDLAAVAAGVARPVLRKDFILDEIQILEARAAGAAAVRCCSDWTDSLARSAWPPWSRRTIGPSWIAPWRPGAGSWASTRVTSTISRSIGIAPGNWWLPSPRIVSRWRKAGWPRLPMWQRRPRRERMRC
jgi:hypothetical protein